MSKWHWQVKGLHRLYLSFLSWWPVWYVRRLCVMIRYRLTGDCGMGGCGYMEPYGFVPEAGCPIHDSSALRRQKRALRLAEEPEEEER